VLASRVQSSRELHYIRSRDSSVSIATGYGVDCCTFLHTVFESKSTHHVIKDND
jgi:hypothetical protein